MYSEQKTDIASLSGKQLPNVPQWIANSQTNINYGSVRAGHGVYFVDGNPTDAINRYWSPPRMMHNVSLQWDGEGIRPSIAIEVRNMANKITEETEIDPLQPALGLRTQAVSDFIGYPMPGRFWMCTLSWNDTKKKAYRSK
jgi:outer membrane receptor protein involved in Fe transport